MHEISIVAALVETVDEISKRENFTKVREIHVEVGALSGIEASCLEFCFSEVVRGSVLEGAQLSLDLIGLELRCQTCGQLSYPEDTAALFCEHCQSTAIEICKGRDFRIVDLEVF